MNIDFENAKWELVKDRARKASEKLSRIGISQLDYNIVLINSGAETPEQDFIDALFGEVEEVSIVRLNTPITWAKLLANIGIFPSVSQAKKAGWNRPVDSGWTDFTIGKRKTQVSVLNILPKND